MKSSHITFFENKYVKFIFGIVILSLGISGGLYFSTPGNAKIEAMEEKLYFETEEMFSKPEGYMPTFNDGQQFPIEFYFDKNKNELKFNQILTGKQTLFILMNPSCDPCEDQYNLFKEKLFPRIDKTTQILICLDFEYQTEQIPRRYQEIVENHQTIYMDYDYILEKFNLHMKPTVMVIDKNEIVRYIQVGKQKYVNKKLIEMLR